VHGLLVHDGQELHDVHEVQQDGHDVHVQLQQQDEYDVHELQHHGRQVRLPAHAMQDGVQGLQEDAHELLLRQGHDHGQVHDVLHDGPDVQVPHGQVHDDVHQLRYADGHVHVHEDAARYGWRQDEDDANVQMHVQQVPLHEDVQVQQDVHGQ